MCDGYHAMGIKVLPWSWLIECTVSHLGDTYFKMSYLHQTQTPILKMCEATSQNEAELNNVALLDEANSGGQWVHAKKTRPIWAKRLELAQTVKTLEGEERVSPGHYLCRGEAGDIWPQTEETLIERYIATDEVKSDGWRKYEPHPDAEGVLAVQFDHAFEVQASWGKLTGKPGDFLVKSFQDRETRYPNDVWIVDQSLFWQTYESVAPGE
jgi:hypothetical protein